MAFDYLIDSQSDQIRHLVLNRPEKLNSWNASMRAEMRVAIEDAAADPDLRVLVISGAGRAFSAGEDVSEMDDLTALGTRGFRVVAKRIHDVFDCLEAMETPVIAAIDGVAAGGGFELALSCDFRIMGENSRLVMPEARVGLIPGSGGCSRLVRHIGLGRAKELVMLGGSITSSQALEWGIVTQVVPDGEVVDAAMSLANRLNKVAPLAVGMAKLVLNSCLDVDAETGRKLERLGQSILKSTSDHAEGARAFIEKRDPKWQGR